MTVDSHDSRWSEWSWRQQYRLWQANREVFLYPENYVLPELRTNASPFFTDLENDLRQSNCDADAAEAAFENYLRKLVGVSRLVVAAHYNQTNSTPTDRPSFMFSPVPPARRRNGTTAHVPLGTSSGPACGRVERLDLAQSRYCVRAAASRDLGSAPLSGLAGVQADYGETERPVVRSQATTRRPQKFWAVQFAMSEFSAGQWQAKHTIDQKMFFDNEDPSSAFTFKAFQDSSFNLQLLAYYTGDESFGFAGISGRDDDLPDGPLSVVEDHRLLGLPAKPSMDLTQEPSYSSIILRPCSRSSSSRQRAHMSSRGRIWSTGAGRTAGPRAGAALRAEPGHE